MANSLSGQDKQDFWGERGRGRKKLSVQFCQKAWSKSAVPYKEIMELCGRM